MVGHAAAAAHAARKQRLKKLEKKAAAREALIDDYFATFDASQTGKMNKEEVRAVLTQVKRERDGLRAGNTAARQQRGLVSSEDLLLDFEKRRQNIVATKEQVQQMQAKHAALLRHVAESKRIQATGAA